MVKIVAISDTHGRHWDLDVPECDILLHAGDITLRGELNILSDFNEWLSQVPAKHKIVIAGNHDLTLENQPGWAQAILSNCTYLDNAYCEIEGLKIYGMPWTPPFCNWAFMDHDMRRHLRPILDWGMKFDIILSHGPAFGILDVNEDSKHCGCKDLLEAIEKCPPRLHVFGHIHEGFGRKDFGRRLHVNASVVDSQYRLTNSPQVISIKL